MGSRGTDPRPVSRLIVYQRTVAEAFAGLLSRAIHRGKTSSSFQRRKTGRVAYIINNCIVPRNNGHESFSLMRIASSLRLGTTTREAKFGVDLFAYVRFNQQMDVTHVV